MITLALSKGRIFTETLPFLAAAGIYPLEDPFPYNTHTHPACLYAKACGLRLCNRCQRVAVAHARQRGECFGACYFGMAEYIFPVPLNRERTQCGIVSVSGYPAQAQTALARANHAAKRLPIDRDKLLSLLPAQSTAIPSLEELRPRIRPLEIGRAHV